MPYISETVLPSMRGSLVILTGNMLRISTLGDLTQNFPTFSNLILNLSFYVNADPKSTHMSNDQVNLHVKYSAK